MERLDKFLVEKKYFLSREKAKDAILNNNVLVDGSIQKPSFLVDENFEIKVEYGENYVSRGAFKLKKAVEVFNLKLEGKTVLDIGSSTGGFTQICLLNNAKKVVACDVGSNVMDANLRKDSRILLFENRDIRDLRKEEVEDIDVIVSDVSFISLTKIFPKIIELGLQNKLGVFLFKPQFECGKQISSKFKGVIKDKKIHIKLLNDFVVYLSNLGIVVSNIDYSPIKGKNGNIEYLILINGTKSNFNIVKLVERAFLSL